MLAVMDEQDEAGCSEHESAVLRLIEHHMFETKYISPDRAIRKFIQIGPDLISG